MKIYIKNMVCNRCKMVVKTEFEKLGIVPISIELGEVTLSQELSEEDKDKLNNSLTQFGFSLISDKKGRLIEQIKNSIIELVHHDTVDLKINLSEFLSQKLHHDYNYLSNLFSEIEGLTIEKFLICVRIERVKELLVYDELNLSEIAYQLNYSSVAHLSAQFKKVTGMTPSHFKKIRSVKRTPLDEL